MKKLLLMSVIGLVLLGAGCASTPAPEEKKPVSNDATPGEIEVLSTSTFTHQKFGFNFTVPSSVAFETDVKYSENGNDVTVSNKKSGEPVMIIIVQPGIPGIPLPDNKVEKLKVGGVAGHLYHDTDMADGGNIDKLIVDFPDGKNTVYVASPELPGQKMLDLKAIAKSWKWKK